MNIFTDAGILLALQTYGYLIMLFLMFLEGPIVTYIAAFLASLGFFNIYLVFIISLLGNIIGDIGLYAIGRFGKTKRINEYFKKKKLEKGLISKIEHGLKNRTGWTMMLVKLTPPHPAHGLIMAGIVEVPFLKFLLYSAITSIPQALIFLLLGFFTGSSFNKFLNYFHKIGTAVAVTSIIVIFIFAIIYLIMKRAEKYEKKL